ncbi:MAG: hypothetical protein ACXVFQ_01425 [Solirubrobacteraceae bacterium]
MGSAYTRTLGALRVGAARNRYRNIERLRDEYRFSREVFTRGQGPQSEQTRDASAVLADRATTGAPFALVLRSFGNEDSSWAVPEVGAFGLVPPQPERDVPIVEALRDRLPVIAVANPAVDPLLHEWASPRIALGEEWVEAVRPLMNQADFVIMVTDQIVQAYSES